MKILHIQENEGLDDALDILFYKKTNLGWTDKNTLFLLPYGSNNEVK